MFWVEVLLLGIMAITGCLCSYKDIKDGVVPNRWLIYGAIPALITQSVYIGIWAFDYLPGWALSMFVAGAFAILLYAAGIWAAGDVKLFFFMFLCIPSRLLDGGGLTYSVVPYIYIFIPAIIWIVGDTIVKVVTRAERFVPQRINVRDIPYMIAVMIEITVLQIVVWGIAPTFCSENELFIAVVMFICAYWCGDNKWMKNKNVIAIFVLALAVFMYFDLWAYSPAEWWVYVVVASVMLFQNIAAAYNYRRIPTNTIRRGMILSSGTILSFSVSQVKNLPTNGAEDMSARLSDIEASAVRRWENSKHGATSVIIVRKIPFASLVTLGILLWMIVRMSGGY